MAHWRVAVHALDRTGPPMLALAFLRWLRRHVPDDSVDIVAFRGGELEDAMAEIGPLEVLLHHHEAWDVNAPLPERVAEISARTHRLPRADATLLVSVSAGQGIDFLADRTDAMVAWVVEQGEDLHWIDDMVQLRTGVDRWIGGSLGSVTEIIERIPGLSDVDLVAEFVEMDATPSAESVAECRRRVGAAADDLLIIGAGIGTRRKAPDLFVEVAKRLNVTMDPAPRFVWIGGETDDLLPDVKADVAAAGLDNVMFVDNVADIWSWFAAADVFLHPARLDAFPLVCLHAAGLGTPVLAFSGVGGVPEMMGDAFAGVPFPDIAGLADVVASLSDPEERRRVGRAQRDRVHGRYSAEVCAPAVFDALQRASGNAATP